MSPLLALVQDRCGLGPETLRLTQFSTLVGAVVVMASWRGRLVLLPVARSGFLVPIVSGAGAAVGVLVGIWAVDRLTSQHWVVLDVATLPNSIAVVLVASSLGAAAEEIGWRGIVQPLIETRTGAIRAMIGTGFLFGVGATAMSVIFGTLSAGRTIFGRAVAATMAHWFVSSGLLLFFSDGDSSAV
ncbi:CPBP family intramembrane glutamic endopeptidase [Rhodococcus sp. IEGM 1379]|uniref:CPBP family intramembrane glutamic endopeptidase n=1 Tax=Rhodococcus sp. IEGM 1379 TaxID=3047086 RepID=UPI0024B70211|nr:CPBP family intramembrane glutamic endopeptidase [Rhodococcus sp. IEGM 1379]MDI9915482.1 CPBP family intramembrane metalloprotease [Rhodococcus sp. IEGM 1379]